MFEKYRIAFLHFINSSIVFPRIDTSKYVQNVAQSIDLCG